MKGSVLILVLKAFVLTPQTKDDIEMKEYANFTAIELAQDEDFIRWVESDQRDQVLNDKWQMWLIENPDKIEVLNDARRLVKAVINERQYFLHDSKQQELWSRIEDSVGSSKQKFLFTKLGWYSIAASISILAIAIFAVLSSKDSIIGLKDSRRAKMQGEGELLKYINESGKTHALVLEDGTVVTLQPHSAIEYPDHFSGNRRDVYLNGEAFFEVVRNPKKPFSVYTDEIVTRVLGTSFSVRAFDKEKDVVIAVRTGKVSVFREDENLIANDSSQNLRGTLLTPNQKIVVSKGDYHMIKSLVESPVLLPNAEAIDNFEFNDTPVHEVFERLEKVYGIEILFDEETMSNCLLNTPALGDIPFRDKLRLICKGINARYEILDAHIIITGNGCK